MSEQLRDLLRTEADRLDVPPPPIQAILLEGRRRRGTRRTRRALALAASVSVIAGGVFGVSQLLGDEARRSGGVDPADRPSPTPPVVRAPLELSGTGVGTWSFGTDADAVRTDLESRLGAPDLAIGPERYARIAGDDGWFRDGDDPLSPSWRYPTASVTCWGTLCLLFGGEDAESLALRGWEAGERNRWADFEPVEDPEEPVVRLEGTGIALGDSWGELRAAYPEVVAQGAEGASLAVGNLPWPGISDGAAAWRLSGQWDSTQPNRAPADAVVTRLSAGEGPEPGCC